MKAVTRESADEELRRVWTAAWYPVAKAIAATDHDCTVLDPDAPEDVDYWSGHGGVIRVRAHTGLGWTVIVTETESTVEVDE